jgi:hypothetical protein
VSVRALGENRAVRLRPYTPNVPESFRGVYQRGEDDCVAACFASVLGLELDELPAIRIGKGGVEQFGDWREWLLDRRIALHPFRLDERTGWLPGGWWIGAYVHAKVAHALVFYQHLFVWDPRPGYGPRRGTIGRVETGWDMIQLEATAQELLDTL